ncbi:MAG: hypothetical protein A3K65_01580 [Euryarchaeota archaeon RBG_16_68_12]|nr:MAG: hypothetical protein A3K65_01580 [Euryarchaeota archaeon RBG_16_68_12]
MAGSGVSNGFVKESRYRIAVIVALQDWPKTTGQLAVASCISAAHTSRTLRELSDRGLVECTTPDLRGRGRLYGLTPLGERLAGAVEWEGRQPVTTPMVRANHPRSWFRVLNARYGREKARLAFKDAGWTNAIDARLGRWVPLRSQLRLIEAVERRFGDGSFQVVRDVSADAVRYFPSIRRYVLRALPVVMLAEFAPAVYLREFNHGRMEVEASPGRAHFMQYDWLSSPARCASWLGTYEGTFSLKKIDGTVRKVECLLCGDEFCGYVAEWEE